MMRTPEAADELFLREAFRLPTKSRRDSLPPAYSAEWFEQIERQRYSRHGHWLPRVLEFNRHAGETLLGLGGGLGTDWLQFARNGAHMIACSDSQDQLDVFRHHFQLRGEDLRVVHAPPHALPFDAASVDVVCLNGVLQTAARPQSVIDEVYRILRPGGKVIAVVPAKFDAAYWQNNLLPWTRWFRRPAQPSTGHTARSLKRDFARFVEPSVKKRHLRRAQLPQLWRPFPLPLLERLLGQFLILKAFKPLSAAMAGAIAA
jgi:ubiquinone/menaquinone biosynthesis C-methylase UbiE